MPTDFGTDLNTTADGDLDITGALINGPRVLAEDIRRRFTSADGSVFYARGESIDLTSYLSQGFTQSGLLKLRTQIANVAQKDERVFVAKVSIESNLATRSLKITVGLDTLAGPFTLVFSVNEATVEILQAT